MYSKEPYFREGAIHKRTYAKFYPYLTPSTFCPITTLLNKSVNPFPRLAYVLYGWPRRVCGFLNSKLCCGPNLVASMKWIFSLGWIDTSKRYFLNPCRNPWVMPSSGSNHWGCVSIKVLGHKHNILLGYVPIDSTSRSAVLFNWERFIKEMCLFCLFSSNKKEGNWKEDGHKIDTLIWIGQYSAPL